MLRRKTKGGGQSERYVKVPRALVDEFRQVLSLTGETQDVQVLREGRDRLRDLLSRPPNLHGVEGRPLSMGQELRRHL